MNTKLQSRWWILLPACTLAILVWTYQPTSQPSPPPSSFPSTHAVDIEAAYQERLSGITVEVTGRVERLLPDDREGSNHQRFILRLPSGRTVLIAHNIDLAPRAPVSAGDAVTVRGEYEYNEKGGVIHWTHHDPEGKRPGGWIRFHDHEYR
ncbi:MAG: DUF3465 domain-containing protein [Nitrospirae bacterium]|nr:DUF3465 domain-containing protein [Nitrospirota bacterium]